MIRCETCALCTTQMADAADDLGAVQSYPLAFCTTLVGALGVALIEAWVGHSHSHSHEVHLGSDVGASKGCADTATETTVIIVSESDPYAAMLSHEHGHSMSKAIVMDLSIAVHSVIIGIALGVEAKYNTIAVLTIAYVFHQMFEGLGLGVTIAGAGF